MIYLDSDIAPNPDDNYEVAENQGAALLSDNIKPIGFNPPLDVEIFLVWCCPQYLEKMERVPWCNSTYLFVKTIVLVNSVLYQPLINYVHVSALNWKELVPNRSCIPYSYLSAKQTWKS